jgi:hypothetical protein
MKVSRVTIEDSNQEIVNQDVTLCGLVRPEGISEIGKRIGQLCNSIAVFVTVICIRFFSNDPERGGTSSMLCNVGAAGFEVCTSSIRCRCGSF